MLSVAQASPTFASEAQGKPNVEIKWDLEKQFDQELHAAAHEFPVSAAKINAITKTAIKSAKFFKHVVYKLERLIPHTSADNRLSMLYVIDSICRNSIQQLGDKEPYVARFTNNIRVTLLNICQCPPKYLSKVEKVVNIWQENKIFSENVIKDLYRLLDEEKLKISVQREKERQEKEKQSQNPASSPPNVASNGPIMHPSDPRRRPQQEVSQPVSQASTVQVPVSSNAQSLPGILNTPMLNSPPPMNSPPPPTMPLNAPPSIPPSAQQYSPVPQYPQYPPQYMSWYASQYPQPPQLPTPTQPPQPQPSLSPVAPPTNNLISPTSVASSVQQLAQESVVDFDYGDDEEEDDELEQRLKEEEREANAKKAEVAASQMSVQTPADLMSIPNQANFVPNLQHSESKFKNASAKETPPGFIRVKSNIIWVGNIPPTFDKDELQKMFAAYGRFANPPKFMGDSMAFFTYESREAAEFCKKDAHRSCVVPGTKLKIGWGRGACPKEQFDWSTGEALLPMQPPQPQATQAPAPTPVQSQFPPQFSQYPQMPYPPQYPPWSAIPGQPFMPQFASMSAPTPAFPPMQSQQANMQPAQYQASMPSAPQMQPQPAGQSSVTAQSTQNYAPLQSVPPNFVSSTQKQINFLSTPQKQVSNPPPSVSSPQSQWPQQPAPAQQSLYSQPMQDSHWPPSLPSPPEADDWSRDRRDIERSSGERGRLSRSGVRNRRSHSRSKSNSRSRSPKRDTHAMKS